MRRTQRWLGLVPVSTASALTAMSHSRRIRMWHRTDNWCSLCKEPFNSWNEHRGKRDHICLELFYDSIVMQQRSWIPDATLYKMLRGQWPSVSFEKLYAQHDRAEHARRIDLFHLLRYLVDAKILFLSEKEVRRHGFMFSNSSFSAQGSGSMVLFKWFHPAIIRLFPNADAKQVSGIAQMVASTYNAETVFDLCGLRGLLQREDLVDEKSGKEIDVTYHYKGALIRSILGQLRWAIDGHPDLQGALTTTSAGLSRAPKEPAGDRTQHRRGSAVRSGNNDDDDDVACSNCSGRTRTRSNANRRSDSSSGVPSHLAVLAQQAGRMLVAETVFCRICEYVCRVEAVWHENGYEVVPSGAHAFALSCPPMVPGCSDGCRGLIHERFVVSGS